jgi:DNA-binding NtrC family response regulator
VLVVDDDPDLRSTVAEFLNMEGFEVAEAENGLEALLKVKRLRPHGVVLDIMMPRLGGLQALQRIRAFDPAITVVVISGVGDADLQRQAALAGASAWLMKPFALSDIAAALRGQVPPAREELPSVRPLEPAAGRVLLVDDEQEIRETLQEFLTEKGYDVRQATNGAAGIAAVAEATPDVVLLDIQMPGLGGVDALAAIRAIAPQVKVIMVSGIPDADVANRALAYGAFDFVAKPIDLAYLERSLETAMSMKEIERG